MHGRKNDHIFYARDVQFPHSDFNTYARLQVTIGGRYETHENGLNSGAFRRGF